MAKIYIDYEHHVETETVKRSYRNVLNRNGLNMTVLNMTVLKMNELLNMNVPLNIKYKNTDIFAKYFDENTRDTILNTMLDNPNIMHKLSEHIVKDYKNKQKQDRTHIMDNLIALAQQVQMKNRQSSENASIKINPMP
jgi:hypothetical protein